MAPETSYAVYNVTVDVVAVELVDPSLKTRKAAVPVLLFTKAARDVILKAAAPATVVHLLRKAVAPATVVHPPRTAAPASVMVAEDAGLPRHLKLHPLELSIPCFSITP